MEELWQLVILNAPSFVGFIVNAMIQERHRRELMGQNQTLQTDLRECWEMRSGVKLQSQDFERSGTSQKS